jgi:hypothetical protein
VQFSTFYGVERERQMAERQMNVRHKSPEYPFCYHLFRENSLFPATRLCWPLFTKNEDRSRYPIYITRLDIVFEILCPIAFLPSHCTITMLAENKDFFCILYLNKIKSFSSPFLLNRPSVDRSVSKIENYHSLVHIIDE